MIDWFPTDTDPAPARAADGLMRWSAFADIARLARTVDLRTPETVGHSARVATTVVALAGRRGWSGSEIALLREAALVHDVGKVVVPGETLNATGRLDPEQLAVVRAHAEAGARIVEGALLPRQVEWVRHHHERYDGAGYPDGLAGEDIPEGARLLALADAWDAMTHRATSGPLDLVGAMEECSRHGGRQFCPRALDALLDVWHTLPPPRPTGRTVPLRMTPMPSVADSVAFATGPPGRAGRFS